MSSTSKSTEKATPNRRHERVIHGGLITKRAVAFSSTGPFQE
jgi:hypothetical protein